MTEQDVSDRTRGDRVRRRIEVVVLVVGLALIAFFVVAAGNYRPTRPAWSPEEQEARATLRRIHAAELQYLRRHGRYAADLRELGLPPTSEHFSYLIVAPRPADEFNAYATWKEAGRGQFLRIDEDGWITGAQSPARRVAPPRASGPIPVAPMPVPLPRER